MCELPALVIDGNTLTQSLAIIDYLDATREGHALCVSIILAPKSVLGIVRIFLPCTVLCAHRRVVPGPTLPEVPATVLFLSGLLYFWHFLSISHQPSTLPLRWRAWGLHIHADTRRCDVAGTRLIPLASARCKPSAISLPAGRNQSKTCEYSKSTQWMMESMLQSAFLA